MRPMTTCIFHIAFFIPLFLAGCSSNQSSVERNARHLAYQIERVHFDPNTMPLTADNASRLEHFLSQFYTQGKKDRVAGLTTAQAQLRVNGFSNDGPFAPGEQKTMVINREYDADQPSKRSDILKKGAIATYWDGFNGRP